VERNKVPLPIKRVGGGGKGRPTVCRALAAEFYRDTENLAMPHERNSLKVILNYVFLIM